MLSPNALDARAWKSKQKNQEVKSPTGHEVIKKAVLRPENEGGQDGEFFSGSPGWGRQAKTTPIRQTPRTLTVQHEPSEESVRQILSPSRSKTYTLYQHKVDSYVVNNIMLLCSAQNKF